MKLPNWGPTGGGEQWGTQLHSYGLSAGRLRKELDGGGQKKKTSTNRGIELGPFNGQRVLQKRAPQPMGREQCVWQPKRV